MSKTKKKGFKFLSILFCFLFLFLAGCDGGPKDDDFDDFEDPNNPGTSTVQSLDGVKVLSKPADYSFSDAVGAELSENYYNLFAREVLLGLYSIYGNNGVERDKYLGGLSPAGGETSVGILRSDSEGDVNRYYFYDSMRCTIDSLNNTDDGQEIVLVENAGWLWTADAFSSESEIIFKDTTLFTVSGNKFILSDDYGTWTEISGEKFKSFDNLYFSSTKGENEKFWTSPFYSGSGGNYFQDALEYATYLFVLGYDYALTDDAPYFDFEISYDAKVTVGGWGSSKISITEALGKVKELYQHLGNYVGVNQKNKEQIVKFIKDKVIGPNAYAKNQFTVEMFENGSKTGEQKFNRNYDKIIENIVEYACSQAPIGKDGEDVVTLGENYLASQITDYDGDYFFASYENEQSDEIFKYIDEAEYQSLVLYPQKGDVGKCFTDLWLAFEYNPNDPNLPALEELTINVGFRYYSCSANGGAGGYVFSDDNPITIKRGEYATFSQESPDTHWFYISDFDGIANITVPKDLKIGTQFKNPDAIKPEGGFGFGGLLGYSSMTITGNSEAREYYMLNDSSSYGAFGSLNGEKFSQNNAGENACDFMELYFDIEKVKGVIANYNFKVALVMYYAE